MRRQFIGAFGRPRGFYGAMAAAVMTVENRAANRAVVDALRLAPGELVLDVGCGPGMAARHAARAVGSNGSVMAIDPAPVMVRAARLVSYLDRSPKIRWAVAGVESLPLETGSITTVIAINSFHHWSDRAAAMSELQRVVRPGGRIVLAQRTPASHHPGARHVDSTSVDLAHAALSALGTVSVQRVEGGADVLAVMEVRPG